jgi:TolB-like protein
LLYSFEDFVLDTDQRELRRGHLRIAIQPQVFDLLEFMIRNRERVVSKDDLIAAIWGGRIVSESALTTRINAARTAIGDSGEDQQFIRTLPRKGVRFVGVVREVEEEKPQPPRAVALPSGAAQAQKPPFPLPDRPSIAVLPFTNMSGDPEQEYFADGMVDEIITGLSRIKWLLVISRNSSFIYKNRPVAVQEVADKLGVRYVLEGGVRKSENHVRITAQLIDAETGGRLWAEQYDRLFQDLFALQDEITMCVIGAIEPSLRKAEINRVKRRRPNNVNAYDLVLRSLPYAYTRMPQEAAIAIPLLEDALKLDPNYGIAHALLGWCLHARFRRGGLRQEDRTAAIHHAHAALVHGNDDATARAAAGDQIAALPRSVMNSRRLIGLALRTVPYQKTSHASRQYCRAHVREGSTTASSVMSWRVRTSPDNCRAGRPPSVPLRARPADWGVISFPTSRRA